MKLKTKRIYEAFNKQMLLKLEANDHKHPDNTSALEMFRAIRDEMDELLIALDKGGQHAAIRSQCANIANFAMFVSYHDGKLLVKL